MDFGRPSGEHLVTGRGQSRSGDASSSSANPVDAGRVNHGVVGEALGDVGGHDEGEPEESRLALAQAQQALSRLQLADSYMLSLFAKNPSIKLLVPDHRTHFDAYDPLSMGGVMYGYDSIEDIDRVVEIAPPVPERVVLEEYDFGTPVELTMGDLDTMVGRTRRAVQRATANALRNRGDPIANATSIMGESYYGARNVQILGSMTKLGSAIQATSKDGRIIGPFDNSLDVQSVSLADYYCNTDYARHTPVVIATDVDDKVLSALAYVLLPDVYRYVGIGPYTQVRDAFKYPGGSNRLVFVFDQGVVVRPVDVGGNSITPKGLRDLAHHLLAVGGGKRLFRALFEGTRLNFAYCEPRDIDAGDTTKIIRSRLTTRHRDHVGAWIRYTDRAEADNATVLGMWVGGMRLEGAWELIVRDATREVVRAVRENRLPFGNANNPPAPAQVGELLEAWHDDLRGRLVFRFAVVAQQGVKYQQHGARQQHVGGAGGDYQVFFDVTFKPPGFLSDPAAWADYRVRHLRLHWDVGFKAVADKRIARPASVARHAPFRLLHSQDVDGGYLVPKYVARDLAAWFSRVVIPKLPAEELNYRNPLAVDKECWMQLARKCFRAEHSQFLYFSSDYDVSAGDLPHFSSAGVLAGRYVEAGPSGYKSVVLPPSKASAWGDRAQFEHYELGFQNFDVNAPYKGLSFRGKWEYNAADAEARPVDTDDGWRVFDALLRQVYNIGGVLALGTRVQKQYRMFRYRDIGNNIGLYTSCSVPRHLRRARSRVPIVVFVDTPEGRIVFGRRENHEGNIPDFSLQ